VDGMGFGWLACLKTSWHSALLPSLLLQVGAPVHDGLPCLWTAMVLQQVRHCSHFVLPADLQPWLTSASIATS